MRAFPTIPGLMVLLTLAGCGGGGGSDSAPSPPPAQPQDPFGLASRESLATFNLPTADGTPTSYELVDRFPALGFSAAAYLTGIPGDDRLAVVEQAGRIRVFDNDPAVSSTRTILDVSGEVLFAGEQGLLGLAFDPDFVSNRYLYVHYSADGPRRSVIARFTWEAASDLVDPASRKILLELEQPFSNHNGGMLAFGPDDLLYIAFGDGGSGDDPGNRAQNTQNLFGTLLRVDVHPADPADDYAIPPDNPFVDDPEGLDEIWAYGLRNPFRFSFDRTSGDLWLGDVGQSGVEEINLMAAGGNYGWRVYEGDDEYITDGNDLPRSEFTFPVHTYEHGGGAAVIGGYVYRGTDVPSLRGRYLYADFVTGQVWALAYDGNAVTANEQIAVAASPTSFGEDNDGEVYLVTRNDGILTLAETTAGGGELPEHLSETGLFSDLGSLTPARGLIEYRINQPFWSDGATKRRWIGIPDDLQIDFSSTGAWGFPTGTVIVKHFELALTEGEPDSRRRLETRVLINTSTDGWRGFTYRWNDQESDADLLSGRTSELITVDTASGPRQQRYDYPGPADCLRCHTEAAGFVLGVKTRQLNREALFADTNVTDNQLRALNHIELFDTDIGNAADYAAFPDLNDAGAALTVRARSYLDINCAQCHRPGGPPPTDLDLRFDTPADAMNAVGAAPQHGDLGATDAAIIAPGDRQRSVLWLRMQTLDQERMPPLSSHLADEAGLSVVGDWIDSL
ncbi:MAG: PQQ-dependent sugar dehydrogenase [Gammaproteobacteria bacterium]|nr:PQQ-dependent sugar dehydrogenase [Gammaproteobacteria bacterium]